MDNNDDSLTSDTCSDGPNVKNLVKVVVVLRRIKALLAKQSPVVNPPCPI